MTLKQESLLLKCGAVFNYVIEKVMQALVGFVAVASLIILAITANTLLNHEHLVIGATVDGQSVLNITLQSNDRTEH